MVDQCSPSFLTGLYFFCKLRRKIRDQHPTLSRPNPYSWATINRNIKKKTVVPTFKKKSCLSVASTWQGSQMALKCYKHDHTKRLRTFSGIFILSLLSYQTMLLSAVETFCFLLWSYLCIGWCILNLFIPCILLKY